MCKTLLMNERNFFYELKQAFCVLKTSNSSFGILGMREGCNNIGAEFTINSQLGQGTEILVSLNCITTME